MAARAAAVDPNVIGALSARRFGKTAVAA